MPREGTETIRQLLLFVIPFEFGNKMPREGTETGYLEFIDEKEDGTTFGNKMPREGTETRT